MSNVEGFGSKTASQWSPALASLGSTLTTYLQDKMLKKIDTDKSGTVGQSEFQAAMEQLTTKLGVSMGEDHSEMFAGLDANGDGELSSSELGEMIRAAFSAPANTQDFLAARGAENKPNAGFDALDVDGDGVLSRAEFTGQGGTLGAAGLSDGAVSMVTTTITSVTTAQYAPSAGSPATSTQQATASANDPLKALMAGLGANRDGQIGSSEVDQFIAQLASQMQLALSQLRDNSSNRTPGGGSSTIA
ncbi:EF-hand domain-containing protein [Hydrogenophaga sp.]|uniref:EF-hand domain-containing protein n=1 Tax=Hydrogenophaga sp. TaxID=1904254 RepID=UPI002716EA01|nr:EF-hand domain-containing protein [Hydrogenophaga sp.]MDO8906090.1 EF-hand domain-containing protein [Hydrogenophaga sp.]